jgi:hypothetical protein
MYGPLSVIFTISHFLDGSLWKMLGFCRKTDCVTIWTILAHYFSYHNNSPHAPPVYGVGNGLLSDEAVTLMSTIYTAWTVGRLVIVGNV